MFIDSKNTTGNEEQKKSISIAIVETIFISLIAVLGINTLLVLVAQGIHLPFKVYLTASPIISLLCLLGSGWICFKQIKNVLVRDYDVVVKLFILGLISAIMILIAPSSLYKTDNYYYIPNAVYFLDHPDQPLDFQIHFLVGESNQPIISPSQGTSMAYDYFRAVIAYYSNTKYLVSYFFSSVVMGLFLPLALFLLMNCFVNDTRRALLGTAVCMALILISVDGSRTFGLIAFWNAVRAKFFVLSTGIPLFAAFSISFFQKPSKTGWLCLLLCTLTMIGMTASATILLAILAMLLLSAFILTSLINSGHMLDWKKTFLHAGLYISSLICIFLYVLLILWMMKSGHTTGNYSTLMWTPEFIGQLELFSNLAFPLTPILMLLSPVLVFVFLKGWQRQFLLIWMALLVIFFLNPIGTKLFIDRVVPSTIYSRLFYLFPFPLAIGVAAANLSWSHKVKHIFEIAIILFALAAYLLFVPKGYNLSFSYNILNIANVNTAQKIALAAPPGTMLAPPELYGLIPMIDGFHPQIRTRYDGNLLWLSTKNRIIRENASNFAGGNVKYINDFSKLLKQNIVQTIVLKKTIFNSPLRAKTKIILQENGFTHEKEIGDYLIVWK